MVFRPPHRIHAGVDGVAYQVVGQPRPVGLASVDKPRRLRCVHQAGEFRGVCRTDLGQQVQIGSGAQHGERLNDGCGARSDGPERARNQFMQFRQTAERVGRRGGRAQQGGPGAGDGPQIQGVTARAHRDGSGDRPVAARHQLMEQRHALLGGERVHPHRLSARSREQRGQGGVEVTAGTRPIRPDDQNPGASNHRGEPGQQAQAAHIRPVQVFEHQQEPCIGGRRLQGVEERGVRRELGGGGVRRRKAA